MPRDDEPNWQDQGSIVVSAGVAVLILVALLVYGVMRTSDSAKVPETVSDPLVVGDPVDVHHVLDVHHQLFGAERPDEPGQSRRSPSRCRAVDHVAHVDDPSPTSPTSTWTPRSTTTFPYPTGGF